MHGSPNDLRFRLQAIQRDDSRRLVTVFGSGLSNGVLPDVEQMALRFAQAMDLTERERTELTAGTQTATDRYQILASVLKHRLGDSNVARVVREAVLTACEEPSDSPKTYQELVRTGSWQVPEGYRSFVRYYASLPAGVQGPILTTNFDPLLEVAFAEQTLPATPFPLEFNTNLTDSMLAEVPGVPILHIHGYWTSTTTLNTIPQLNREREQLDSLLTRIMRGAIVLVVGYGGWRDSFMKALERRASELDLLDSELLWASYSEEGSQIAQNPVLRGLIGSPHINFYTGVDGNQLFRRIGRQATELHVIPGFAVLDFQQTTAQHPLVSPIISPDASDRYAVSEWPVLESGRQLLAATEGMLAHGDSRLVVALGPMGEGKTVSMHQVARTLISGGAEVTVIWRLAGAPRMTHEWFKNVLYQIDGNILICIDEADLVASELVETSNLWSAEDSRVRFLLASQDRLWERVGRGLPKQEAVIFEGISREDAEALSERWIEAGLGEGRTQYELAQDLYSSAHVLQAGRRGTLFGGMLDLLTSGGLQTRVRDLLDRLRSLKLGGTDSSHPVFDAYSAICVMQHLFDPYAELSAGISRDILAAVVSVNSELIDGAILRELGREAAITISGDLVYSRHPAIAKAVFRELQATGALEDIVFRIGRAGGRLRYAGGYSEGLVNYPYRLFRKLDGSECVAAARGAVEGAGVGYLEPRVSLLAALRKSDPEKAKVFAEGLISHIDQFVDWNRSSRGFLVEYSYVASLHGEGYYALGLAALSLTDGVGRYLDQERASYGLRCLATMALKLPDGKTGEAIAGRAFVVLQRLVGEERGYDLLPWMRKRGGALSEHRRKSSGSLVTEIVRLAKPAVGAIQKERPWLDGRNTMLDLMGLLDGR